MFKNVGFNLRPILLAFMISLLFSNAILGQSKSKIIFFKDKLAIKEVKKGPYKMVISQINDSVSSRIFSKTRNGRKLWEKYFMGNQPYGTWIEYDKKGNIIATKDYNFVLNYGKFIPEKALTLKELGISPENDINFPNIMKHLKKHFKYPQSAIANGYEGTVLMQFTVDEFGKVGNIRIVKRVAMSLDITCYKIIKALKKLKPYKFNGKPVMAYFTLPIKFKLEAN